MDKGERKQSLKMCDLSYKRFLKKDGRSFTTSTQNENGFPHERPRNKELKADQKRILFKRSRKSRSAEDLSTLHEPRNYHYDLTPGSVEVWLDLPEEIKYDPSLAPFQHLYQQQQDRKNSGCEPQPTEATSLVEADKREAQIDKKNEATEPAKDEIELVTSLERNGEQILTDITSAKLPRTKLQAVGFKCIQAVLVASWIFLMTALLLNPETEEISLHTAVMPGEVKAYKLEAADSKNVKVLLRLTGPFSNNLHRNSTLDSSLNVWIHSNTPQNEQDSKKWSAKLVPVELLDFAPSQRVTTKLNLKINSTLYDIGEENKTKFDVEIRLTTTGNQTVPLTMSYLLNPLREEDGIIYASLLLLGLYILIIFDILSRPLAAMLTSSLAIAVLAMCGTRPTLQELITWLDVETLLLLFSMMILVAILADTGLFDYLAVLAFEVTGGRTWPLINCLCFFTAILSTFLDNVTTVLLMTPVTIRLCEVMELNPVPVLMSMVIYSNVGGAATPVGDPPNVIIASHSDVISEGINFTMFTLHMSCGIFFVCIQTYLQLRFKYRDVNKLRHTVPTDIQELRQEILVWKRAAATLSSYSRDEEIVRNAIQRKVERLQTSLSKREVSGNRSNQTLYHETLKAIKLKYRIRDWELLIKSVICVTFVVAVFFLHAIPVLQRLSLGWTALLGAILLLILAEYENLEPILSRVEWSTLLFFAALFVLMEALSKLGLIIWIGKLTEMVIMKVDESSRLAVAILLVLWVSGLASAFVDNIPLTTMMVRVVTTLSVNMNLPLSPILWALSFGACLGVVLTYRFRIQYDKNPSNLEQKKQRKEESKKIKRN